jgi:hypothetical protein
VGRHWSWPENREAAFIDVRELISRPSDLMIVCCGLSTWNRASLLWGQMRLVGRKWGLCGSVDWLRSQHLEMEIDGYCIKESCDAWTVVVKWRSKDIIGLLASATAAQHSIVIMTQREGAPVRRGTRFVASTRDPRNHLHTTRPKNDSSPDDLLQHLSYQNEVLSPILL